MARMETSASRMMSLRLKKRLKTAQKGHKLLKDKQDELMRHFLELIDTIKGLRSRTESHLIEAMRRFVKATSALPREEIKAIFEDPPYKPTLNVETKTLMNLKIPSMSVEFGEGDTYGLLSSPSDIDYTLEKVKRAIEILVSLAEAEKKMELLADELDKTRRRVNALEYILIPDLGDTIKFIKMRLDEMERGNLTRLMKVKDMLEQKEKESRAS